MIPKDKLFTRADWPSFGFVDHAGTIHGWWVTPEEAEAAWALRAGDGDEAVRARRDGPPPESIGGDPPTGATVSASELETVYRERNDLAALAAKLADLCGLRAGLYDDPEMPGWPVVSLALPDEGEVTWHVREPLPGLRHIERCWDGHSRSERDDRLRRFLASAARRPERIEVLGHQTHVGFVTEVGREIRVEIPEHCSEGFRFERRRMVIAARAVFRRTELSEPELWEALPLQDHPHLKGVPTNGRKLAQARGWMTVGEAARRCGVEPATWRAWEEGDALASRELEELVRKLRDGAMPDEPHASARGGPEVERLDFAALPPWTAPEAWAAYRREHDPPGLSVYQRCVDGLNLCFAVRFDGPGQGGPGDDGPGNDFATKEDARAAAWAWYERRLALSSRLCDEDGRTLECGAARWPECLTWSDEEVERTLAGSGASPRSAP